MNIRSSSASKIPENDPTFAILGEGALGGKASGLARLKARIEQSFPPGAAVRVGIPALTVITTEYFDRFMADNNLHPIALSEQSDERIAWNFLKASMPADLSGPLRTIAANTATPLAIRSSSMLEDSLEYPFAGVYETKMIPNNQPDIDVRFQKLLEAIKFVYASTFFSNAKSYIKTTPYDIRNEKMAVIIQEVVGLRHGERFYPTISGVARSINFYPTGHAEPADGVVNLALGLGKTIVDGGRVWTYSPSWPEASPPFNSSRDMLQNTQTEFWAVNMGRPPSYHPTKETEYLKQCALADADYDNTLRYTASTWDAQADRIYPGVGNPGPRIINFAPALQLNMLPLNSLIRDVLTSCEKAEGGRVEIEFAITFEHSPLKNIRFGLLQSRPMAVSEETVDVEQNRWDRNAVLAAASSAMGNGTENTLRDIVWLPPETFSLSNSRRIAEEVSQMNQRLLEEGRGYVLIGFGRWGSSDPWLGVPVTWSDISGARVMVECQLGDGAIDLSQGSHFFHNLTNLGVLFLSISRREAFAPDWEWLAKQEERGRGQFVRHIRLTSPLSVKVDGRGRKGVIFK